MKNVRQIFVSLTLFLVFIPVFVVAQNGRTEIELAGEGWRLWLDHAAEWYSDDIHLPPVDVSSLPVNPPTIGWDELHSGNLDDREVSVPGTVEEYYWGEIGGAETSNGARTGGDFVGVSWWSRTFSLPSELEGKRITIRFEQVNLRAEVFINGQLVGYDVIGNTPFEFDATDAVMFGEENRLDVRITDPVGNFTWDDNTLMRWGDNLIPAVHGFGGITGGITLQATDDVRISDIYVQNQPDPKSVRIFTTLDNHTGRSLSGQLSVVLHEYGNPDAVVWNHSEPAGLSPEGEVIDISATVPDAGLWELAGYGSSGEETKLYEAAVTFNSGDIEDTARQRFGFRWFDVGEKDGDKRFYLNGERVFMMAAMTRGFWPVNGIFATPEMAERDRDTMVELGMNTMLMHRAVGQPPVFEYADKSGLMAYQEPSGYRITGSRWDNIEGPDDQARELRREKLRRVVIRDRSLPSYMILNLKNEAQLPPDEDDVRNMLLVHELDPSRILTYNSDRNYDIEYDEVLEEDPYKMHMLPFDNTLRYSGWWDHHYWVPFSGYVDENYNNPGHYLRDGPGNPRMPLPEDSLLVHDPSELIFHGEEGAFGTIVRLQQIKEELDRTGDAGFREKEHIDWFHSYDRFLDESGFRESYPDVDALTMSLGRNLHYFQARNIENVRMGNVADAYVMNGWASGGTRTDVVDMYRNPTADPAIISHYTQPLYVAVKLRNKVLPSGATPVADFYLINELDLNGPHRLDVDYTGPDGEILWSREFDVNISGGEVFGELLVEDVGLPAVTLGGHYKLEARVVGSGNSVEASGFDEVFGVDLNSGQEITSQITVLEEDGLVRDFLEEGRGLSVDTYSVDAGEMELLVIGNHSSDELEEGIREDIIRRAMRGTKVIVLENADGFADTIDNLLRYRPELHQGDGTQNWGAGGRFFVNRDPVLTGLPQGEGMSWEYQAFYKPNAAVGLDRRVQGLRLHHWNHEAIVALGNQGSKEILTALGRVPAGEGVVILSTLNIIPNLHTDDVSSVVARKLFLNLLEH